MPTYTIGSTNPTGASNGSNTGIAASSLWLTKRTLSGAAAGAKWTALRAWITGSTTSGTKVRLAIYDDLAGSPNNLVGGGELTIAISAAAAEYTFTLPGTANANNGDYWVGFHLDISGGVAPWYATSGGTMAYGNPSYAAGLPATYSETGTNGVNDIRVAADAATAAAAATGNFLAFV
jgi:hypothetical protein